MLHKTKVSLIRLIALGFIISLSLGFSSQDSTRDYTVIRVNPQQEPLSLFWQDENGQAFKRFSKLAAWLNKRQQHLSFAMNAGIYQTDYKPLGLLIIDGQELSPLNLHKGYGNFYLQPNGIFLVTRNGQPKIIVASTYPTKLKRNEQLATQSGPLLVRDNIINPNFSQKAKSKYIRNGVGVVNNEALFVISEKPVTFYEFASFFRDKLHCSNALYLDGAISGIYTDEPARNLNPADLSAIIGLVKPLQP